LARLTEEVLGPYKIIGHFCGEINGPTQVVRQDSPKKFWAHTKSIIGHFCEDTEKINGPIWMLWQWLWADQVLSTPLLRWAHSELSATLFGNGCGPILKYRHLCFGGPIQEYRHLCFGRPTQDYRHQYSAMAMGPPRIIDISPSVGPFRFLSDSIQQWLWAHLRISSSLFWSAHLLLSTSIFDNGYGPTQEYQHLPFSGPIQVFWQHYSVMAVGPFKNIVIFVLVGPLIIIDINI
jgi:hypothetical protein